MRVPCSRQRARVWPSCGMVVVRASPCSRAGLCGVVVGGTLVSCAYTVACILDGMAKEKRPREPWTAERIAALRAELGLTQAAMAAELGVRQQTISEWETGQYEPRGASVRMLGLLAEGRSAYDAGGESAP